MFWRFFSVITIFIFAISKSSAAEIKITKLDSPDYDSLITLVGDFTPGDSFRFQAIANTAKSNSIVTLSSRGGRLLEGINVGRKIREMGFATAVYDVCASACALAWLAGTKKYMDDGAKIGFHLAYFEDKIKRESGQGNAIVGLNLGELGYRQNVVEYVTTASPDSMQWLSLRDAKLLGIGASVYASGNTNRQESSKPQKREDLAVLFVLKGIKKHTKPAEEAVRWITSNYGSKIYYFEEFKSLSEVTRDKTSYFKRWPSRKTIVNQNSLGVECKRMLCFVSGTYFWSVESPARNKNASGQAKFFYSVLMESPLQIVGEAGEVLSRY